MIKIDCPACVSKRCDKATIRDGRCTGFAPDSISYAQHRFYRGIILPAICDFMGESNHQFCHDFRLKPEWIYRQTGRYYYVFESYGDIPEKHQKDSKIWQPEGCNFFAMIPSMKTFTKAETKDYLKFCDSLLYEIGGGISEENSQEYRTLRDRVL